MLKIAIITYLILFGIVPIIFHYCSTIQVKILFLNFGKQLKGPKTFEIYLHLFVRMTKYFNYSLMFPVQWPLNVDFSNPELVGMKGTRNFYLTTDQHVKLGLW